MKSYRRAATGSAVTQGTITKCILVVLFLSAFASLSGPRQEVAKAGQSPGETRDPRNQQPPLRSPGTRSERGRALTGRVVGDGGQPIAGASVVALAPGSNASLTAMKRRTALTNEAGRFVIEDLSSGAYSLTAFVPGFITSTSTPGKPTYYRPGDSATINLVKGAVVTGAVASPTGDPVVGIRVRAMLVRETTGRPARPRALSPIQLLQDWKTDDRGIYRIFGLEAGSYVVSAGGPGLMNFTSEGYDRDAPTFHPSSTRDTAVEVKLQAGEEIAGVDIQYRESRGHIISGMVSGQYKGPLNSALALILTHAGTGAMYSFVFAPFTESARSFQFDGVADGSYDLTAFAGDVGDNATGSRPRRIEVKGQDVTGIELSIAPFGSIGGRVLLERASGADSKPCSTGPQAQPGDFVISVRQDDKDNSQIDLSLVFGLTASGFSQDGVPEQNGDFKIRPLEAGRYRIEVDLPAEDWFVRAITLPGASQTAEPVDAARSGLPLKSGERISRVTVAVSQGAAGITGRVMPARQGISLPPRLRLHLLPAEKEAAHDVVRFFEATTDKDGAFAIAHIPPGRYLVLAREFQNQQHDETSDANSVPAAWNSDARAKLRREAEAANIGIEFLRCQKVSDFVLRYSPPTSGTRRDKSN